MIELDVAPLALRFRAPVRTAFGVLEERALLRVTLTAGDGVTGVAEAAPLEPYDGVSLAAVAAALEGYREALREFATDAAREAVLEACRALDPLPQALAAIDLALWDREGRRTGCSVAKLLLAGPGARVPVNATIDGTDANGVGRAAEALARAGFECLKLKVGVGEDVARVRAARAGAGAGIALRLDANGAWSEDEAVALLGELAALDIELCEEPVHGVEALRRVRARLGGSVALAMDETTAEPGAAGSGATEAVCLKIAADGGITGVLRAAEEARAAGSEPYLASTFDGPAGIAAGLAAAAALGTVRPCGLATLGLFEGADPFPPAAGHIAVPAGPGLGV